jgi:hypothetical protein
MPLARIQFEPGVVKDETPLAARPRWTDSDKVRFYRQRPQPIGGWELASPDTVSGKCRGTLAWSDNSGTAYGAFGTHTKLYAFYGGRIYNITPIRTSDTLGSDPIATTSGSATVTVTHSSFGGVTGDTVYISGATAVGGITIGGSTGSLSNPFTTAASSKFVEVTDTDHGMSSGDIASFANASAVGGITIDGDYTVYVLDEDTYRIEHSSAATSAATGGGSPDYEYFTAYVLTKVTANTYTVEASSTASSTATGGGSAVKAKYEISVGNEYGLGGGGFGVGTYGSGGFGVGSTGTNYARTWSLAQWGQYLNANPRGGPIYEWQLNTSTRAAAVSNAPSAVTAIFVTPQRHLVALGAHNGSSAQPMRVAWTDQENNTVWTASTTNQAGSFPLAVGSRIVNGKASLGQNLIWTDQALYYMRFNGDPSTVFSFDTLGTDCGLLGANAFAEQDGKAIWAASNKQFYIYDGGAPRVLDSTVRNYFFDNLSAAQEDLVFAYSNTQYAETWFSFPFGNEDIECSHYVAQDALGGWWIVGTFDRTAWLDRSVLGNIIGVTADGNLYFHETGTSDNGSAISAYIESSPFELGQGDQLMDVLGYYPDFHDLSVGVLVTLKTKIFPQDSSFKTFGPYTVTPTTTLVKPRARGRQCSVRFATAMDPSAYWRGGDLRFNVQPGGLRG